MLPGSCWKRRRKERRGEAEVASYKYSVRLIEILKDADPRADITLRFNGSRGWLADRIVSLERVYPGNRDWRRDLERGGSRGCAEIATIRRDMMTRRYRSRGRRVLFLSF